MLNLIPELEKYTVYLRYGPILDKNMQRQFSPVKLGGYLYYSCDNNEGLKLWSSKKIPWTNFEIDLFLTCINQTFTIVIYEKETNKKLSKKEFNELILFLKLKYNKS